MVEIPGPLRDTRYAREVARAAVQWLEDPSETARIELLEIHGLNDAREVRFSWWPKGRMAQRPLDCSEDDLILLLAAGAKAGVLSPTFLPRLILAMGESER